MKIPTEFVAKEESEREEIEEEWKGERGLAHSDFAPDTTIGKAHFDGRLKWKSDSCWTVGERDFDSVFGIVADNT